MDGPGSADADRDAHGAHCSECLTVYEPEWGDPRGAIPPGTPFENLPVEWTCPVCGAAKDAYETGAMPPAPGGKGTNHEHAA
jgi:rubredoxin